MGARARVNDEMWGGSASWSSEKTYRSHGRRSRVVGRLAEHVGARKPEVGTEEVNDDCAYTWREESVWLRGVPSQPEHVSPFARLWAGGSPIAGSGAGGACWWSMSRSLCLPTCCHRHGAARVCKLELILADDVAVDLQEVGRGSKEAVGGYI